MNELEALYKLTFGEDVPILPERSYTEEEIGKAILENKPLNSVEFDDDNDFENWEEEDE